MQSTAEVLGFLANNPPPLSPLHAIPVISIAPQSLASLSRVLNRLRAFFRTKLDIQSVFDTTFARHLALTEHVKEFQERRKMHSASNPQLPMLASACPGWVCYAEKTHAEMLPFMGNTKSPQQVMGTLVKKWMGSKFSKTPDKIYHITIMPCYDKKLEASRKDFYDEIYSTRDVDCVLTTGELEKLMCDRGFNLRLPVLNEDQPLPSTPDNIPDLIQHAGSSSGSYLQQLINSLSSDILNPIVGTRRIRSDYEEHTLTNADTGEIVFRGAKCYGFRNLQNIVRKVGKDNGLAVGRGAAAGRMRGRSTGGPTLRAIARKRAIARAGGDDAAATEGSDAPRGYDYVEVMACPGGCVNGGGQLKPAKQNVNQNDVLLDSEGFSRDWELAGARVDMTPGEGMMASERWGDKDWIKRVEDAYWRDYPTPPVTPPQSVCSDDRGALSNAPETYTSADELAEHVLEGLTHGDEVRRKDLFRTQYHAVESDVIGLAVKW
ncbi:iron hydrogenase [Cantharellus anzutake]|uniref:iron hydrogenase n=1 Tax=Cantharellus anzutake TaxID=1750568 RepID=UPI0019079819|nr:iron hydrogenase [Cantharellus anzutake]KAF8326603.1 iron hydrogenase [Cantharellus anzutake]